MATNHVNILYASYYQTLDECWYLMLNAERCNRKDRYGNGDLVCQYGG
jgi:hypothetical protein